MLTRRDFNALAVILNEPREAERARVEIAHMIAAYCATQNPKFDRDRFLKACGID